MTLDDSSSATLVEIASRRPRTSRSRSRFRRFVQRVIARLLRERDEYQDSLDMLLAIKSDEVGRVVAELQNAISAISEESRVSRGISDSVDSHTVTLGEHFKWIRGLTADVQNVDGDLKSTSRRIARDHDVLGTVQQSVADVRQAYIASADALKGLAEKLFRQEIATKRAIELSQELDSPPFMTDYGAFVRHDEKGEELIGYRSDRSLPRAGVAFEDIFRGSEDMIRERQRIYVSYLAGCSPILELGSGRGELLDLLAEAGVKARGVDSNETMVDRCVRKGLDVAQGDALQFMQSVDDRSMGAVVAIQFIEHLDFGELWAILNESFRVLQPNGLVILETVNPYSLAAFRTFWTDLTHEKPIYPEVLLSLLGTIGFDDALVIFPNGIGRLAWDRLHTGEYAVMAAKSLAES